MAPTLVTSVLLLRFPGLHSHALTWKSSTPDPGFHLEAKSHLLFLPDTASLCFYLCMQCFAMFLFAFLLPPTLEFSALPISPIHAMFPNPLYKTLNFV